MHRSLFLTAVAALVACDSSSTSPVLPPGGGNELGAQITIGIDIIGDSTLADNSYNLSVDGGASVKAGTHLPYTLYLTAGPHRFDIKLDNYLTHAWCTLPGSGSVAGTYAAGSKTEVRFSMDCPSLIGVGTMNVVIAADRSGTPVAADFPIKLARTNGERISLPFTLPANVRNTLSLPPGIYELTGTSTAGCSFPSGLAAALSGLTSIVVRPNSTAGVTISATC